MRSGPRPSVRFDTVALVISMAGVTACSEPTDCAVESGRCQAPIVSSLTAAPAPAQLPALPQAIDRGARAGGAGSAAEAVARPRPSGNAPDQRGGELAARPAMLPGDTMAARRREGLAGMMAPRDQKMGAEAGADDRKVAMRKVLAEALPALRGHDFALLKAVASQRFAGQFVDIQSQHSERFWRHVDRYVPALTGARLDLSSENLPDGRIQGTIRTDDGKELKPIFIVEQNMWKIDRF